MRPHVTRTAGSPDKPHCGRCGTEYDRDGYANGLDIYKPRCTCWTLAPEAHERCAPLCHDCEEPGKCRIMGCGIAAMVHVGLVPKELEGTLLKRVADRLEALEDAVLRRMH